MNEKQIPILESDVGQAGVGQAGGDPQAADEQAERRRLVQSLRMTLQRMEGERGGRHREEGVASSGCAALDRLLPEGGWRRGMLVEWLSSAAGDGAGTLALIAARQAAIEWGSAEGSGVIVVLDRQRRFYPPAAAALGVDLEKLIVVRPRGAADEIWALDQVLRCPGVAAVWGAVERLDEPSFRRLQLAVEESGGLGLLLRPEQVRGQPSWAHLQLVVEPCAAATTSRASASSSSGHSRTLELSGSAAGGEVVPSGWRRVRVERTRCRVVTGAEWEGRPPAVELEMDEMHGILRALSSSHETPPLPLAAPLAHPAALRRSARA